MPLEPITTNTQLTTAEVSVIEAITAGTYFIFNEVPTGNVNGVNTTFTLSFTPNPTASLRVFVGLRVKWLKDYGLKNNTIIFYLPLQTGEEIVVDYLNSPI